MKDLLRHVWQLFVFSMLLGPLAAWAQPAAAGASLQGILTVMVGDPNPALGGASRRIYMLTTDGGERFEIDLAGAELPQEGLASVLNGRVEVQIDTAKLGRTAGDQRLPIRALQGLAMRQKVTGSQAFLSIMCKFGGSTAEPRTSPFFQTQLGTTAPGFNHYFREASYNTLNLDGSTTTTAWVQMPQPRTFYIDGVKKSAQYLDELFKDCTNAVGSAIDFSKFYGINLMFNDKLDDAAWGGGNVHTLSGINKAWPATWMPYWGETNPFGWRNHSILAHEMAHAFGAPHSESPDGNEYGSSWDVVSSPGSTADGNECSQVDATYGCIGQHMNAYAKVVMGIMPAARMATHAGGTQTYTLERLAQPPTSTSTVMLRINVAGTDTRFYTVESRFRVGYDLTLPDNGVIINRVTPANDRPARLMVPSGGTGAGLGGTQARWLAGSTFTSTEDNITIKVNSIAADGTASITVGTATATTSLTVTPPSLDFGGQSMRTSAPAQTLTISNTTAAAVSLAGGSIVASSDTSSFSVTHNCPDSLAVGSNCTATVVFTPRAEGVLTGRILVSGVQGATLTGTGEKSLVTHYYRSILRRAPDNGGKAFWNAEATRVAGLGANVNETWFALALSFYLSSEYQAFNRNPTEFVRDLYNTFFNRAADASGLDYWTGQIASGLPREVVLVAFMFSSEFSAFAQTIFGNTAARAEVDTVIDFYRGLLARLPDSGGFTYWVGLFRAAQCSGAAAVYQQVEAISVAYAESAEYVNRNRSNTQYITDMYNAFLRRGGDLGGVQFWIGQLDTGARTRSKVRQDFIASPEFSARVAAVIAQGCQQ